MATLHAASSSSRAPPSRSSASRPAAIHSADRRSRAARRARSARCSSIQPASRSQAVSSASWATSTVAPPVTGSRSKETSRPWSNETRTSDSRIGSRPMAMSSPTGTRRTAVRPPSPACTSRRRTCRATARRSSSRPARIASARRARAARRPPSSRYASSVSIGPDRRSNSSASVCWSSGSAPGRSTVAATSSASSPGSTSVAAARAGRTTASSISVAVIGTTFTTPGQEDRGEAGVQERSVVGVRAEREHDADGAIRIVDHPHQRRQEGGDLGLAGGEQLLELVDHDDEPAARVPEGPARARGAG